MCRLTCHNRTAFADGSSRKMYFCDMSNGKWRPAQIENKCSRRLGNQRQADCRYDDQMSVWSYFSCNVDHMVWPISYYLYKMDVKYRNNGPVFQAWL